MRNTEVILTFLANLLYVAAALLLVRVVFRYFGAAASSVPGEAMITLTSPLVLPIGLRDVRSLYGGVFDSSAAVTMGLVLLSEWSLVRMRHGK